MRPWSYSSGKHSASPASKLDLLHHFDTFEVQRRRLYLISCESHREALITVLDRASRVIHNDKGEDRE